MASEKIFIDPIISVGRVAGSLDTYLSYSVTCAVTVGPTCSDADQTSAQTSFYNFCTDKKGEFKLPYDPPTNQTLIPQGLVCDSTPRCVGGKLYTATCYEDYSEVASCRYSYTRSGSYSSSYSQSWLSKNLGSIIPGVIGSIIALCCLKGCLEACLFGGNGLRPSQIKAYYADRRNQDKQRHKAQDIEREKRRDEAVKIEANRVRREQELSQAFYQGVANRALREENIKLTLEKARDEIVRQRHDLKMREVERQTELTNIVENSKDAQNQRLAQRFKGALALRAAKREEELKASGNNIKVIESNIIENGKVVGRRQEIQRERYARTDAEAHAIMGAVGNDLHQITQPQSAYGGNNGNRNGNNMM
ncbi:hypothetical protein HDU81_000164 [Chytriomyces hyalinus]|nr:hypothetical protein HDU81_000164 [Chytriomyces hyalinus]